MTTPSDAVAGASVRAAREAAGITLRGLAAIMGVSPSHLSDLEHGRRGWSEDLLTRANVALSADAATLDRWCASAGIVRQGLRDALIAHPERWNEVRRLLAGGKP